MQDKVVERGNVFLGPQVKMFLSQRIDVNFHCAVSLSSVGKEMGGSLQPEIRTRRRSCVLISALWFVKQ